MDSCPASRVMGESARAFQAFCWWVESSPRPAHKDVAERFRVSLSCVRAWASRNNWSERAAEVDSRLLSESLSRRETDREAARQRLVDSLDTAVSVLLGIADGRILSDGDQVPVLDRHGVPVMIPVEREGEVVKVAQTRAAVSVTERRRAALAILEMSGVAPPKRLELTGADGAEIRLRARAALSDLTGEQLAALARAFGVDL